MKQLDLNQIVQITLFLVAALVGLAMHMDPHVVGGLFGCAMGLARPAVAAGGVAALLPPVPLLAAFAGGGIVHVAMNAGRFLLLPLALLTCLGGSGCAAFFRQPVALQAAERDALGCASQAAQQEIAGLTPAVLDALAGNSPDWQAQLGALEARAGSMAMCTVAHVLYDALGGAAPVQSSADQLRPIIASSTDTLPGSGPSRQIVQRAVLYLREHPQRQAAPAR